MSGYQKRGEGRVVIGLPERLEKAKAAVAGLEDKLNQINLVVASRPVLGDEATLNEVQNILRGADD